MLSPPPSADEDAISTRQQWLQTHTHTFSTQSLQVVVGCGKGESHIQNIVLSVQEYESGGRGRCIHFGKVESVVDFQMRIIYAWYLIDIGYFISRSKKSCLIFETDKQNSKITILAYSVTIKDKF